MRNMNALKIALQGQGHECELSTCYKYPLLHQFLHTISGLYEYRHVQSQQLVIA